jgi:hypothetical protein
MVTLRAHSEGKRQRGRFQREYRGVYKRTSLGKLVLDYEYRLYRSQGQGRGSRVRIVR